MNAWAERPLPLPPDIGEPLKIIVEAERPLPPPPDIGEPIKIIVEAERSLPPPPVIGEPVKIIVEAERPLPPPPDIGEPIKIIVEATRPNSCEQPEKGLDAAVALVEQKKLGSAEQALDKIDIEQCPDLVPKIEAERTKISDLVDGLIRESEAAMQGCATRGVAAATTKLRSAEHPRLSEAREKLTRFASAVTRAKENHEDAKGKYLDGDFAGAIDKLKSALTSLDSAEEQGICQVVRDRIKANIAEAEKLQTAMEKIAAAISSCDAAKMAGISKAIRKLPKPHTAMTAKLAELDSIAPKVANASASYENAKTFYGQGNLGEARAAALRAREELRALGGSPACQELNGKITSALDKIAKLEAALARADAVIASCSVPDIKSVLRKFSANPAHMLIRGKIGELKEAMRTCGKAEKSKDRVAEANATCQKDRRFGPGYYAANFQPDGRFFCIPNQATANRKCESLNRDKGTGWLAKNIRNDGGFDCLQSALKPVKIPEAVVLGSCSEPGVKILYSLFDYPPYAGRNVVCQDDGGGLLLQTTANRVYRISRIDREGQNQDTGCFDRATVVTETRNYGGRLCPN